MTREIAMIEKPFHCQYTFDGADWAVEIYAKDFAEASRRLRAIGMTGQVKGITVATVKVGPGWLGRLLARLLGQP